MKSWIRFGQALLFFSWEELQTTLQEDPTTKLYKCYLANILNKVRIELMKMNHFLEFQIDAKSVFSVLFHMKRIKLKSS